MKTNSYSKIKKKQFKEYLQQQKNTQQEQC